MGTKDGSPDEVLREVEQKYRALVETTDTGYVILDMEGRVLDANQEYLRLTGRQAFEEIRGHRVTEWTAPYDQNRNAEEVRKCIERGRVRNLEIDYVSPDGHPTPIEVNATTLQTSEGTRILALCKDITERRKSDRALRELESLFNLFMEHSPVYVFFKDADLRVLRLSHNYEQMLGRPMDQILGKTMDDLFPPELAANMIADDMKVLRGGEPYRVDEELGGRYFTTVKFPVLQDGKPGFLAGFTLDITDRKRAEIALQASESRFRTVFEQSAVGMVIATLDGRFLQANTAFQFFLGYSELELQGMRFMEVTHPDFISADLTCIQACIRGEISYYRTEKLYLKKGGREIWGRVNVTVVRDEGGQPFRLLALIEDISEREAAREALQQSEAKFSSLFESMIEGVAIHEVVYDSDGKPIDYLILDVNPAYKHHTGIDLQGARGKRASEVYGLNPPPLLAEFGQVAKDGQPCTIESYVEGMNKYFRVSVFSPRRGFFATVFEDITAQKRNEEERRRLEAEVQHVQQLESLGSLAGGVAHDMNNILQAIQGMASVLKVKFAADPALISGIDIILNASHRGRDLVKNLTNFARKGLQETQPLDLNQIVRKEVQLLEHTTMQRIELTMDLTEPLPPILGDPSSVGNALMNLCVNAIDAMPGKGTLRFQTKCTEAGFVELTVEDSGQGMSPDVLAHATEPFFTTKPTGKGTGLGLSGVYGTMKAHNGTMEIKSEMTKGTRVILRFPVLPGAAVAEETSLIEPKREGGRPLRILLVDDDELIRDSFPDLMEILGHKVIETAAGGAQALEALERGLEVDVVILDHNMPGLSGMETLERIQALRPSLPIVLSTGHLDESTRTRLKGRTRVWTLMKPYSIRDIRPLLAEVAQS